MREIAAIVTVLSLLLTWSCREPIAPVAPAPQPELRPMESLKPLVSRESDRPAKPTAPAAQLRPEKLKPPAPLPEITAPPAAKPAPTYTVMKTDTLWSIAKRQLGNGQRWKDIVAENPGLDPGKLTPGQTLRLPAK